MLVLSVLSSETRAEVKQDFFFFLISVVVFASLVPDTGSTVSAFAAYLRTNLFFPCGSSNDTPVTND